MWKLSETTESGIRRGILKTKSGVVSTPFFMPDATRATVRGLSSEELVGLGIEALVVNTFHLYLQPGTDLIQKAGLRFADPRYAESSGEARAGYGPAEAGGVH